ncbi:tyrosine-protein phosphatase yvh1 isoform X1 [Tetranychus urticae]|uniref:protein-tyrosine-phosphatase n=1 Tax=Tetranychus urticae TaxID=32264 RepID=T1KDE7_TETUR|nr:tyrosine-protein phosphatase yvh1 isoform X1 [Tetranychus urticae]
MMNGNISLIDKHVYLSDVMAAMSSAILKQYQIKHIITANIKPLSEPLVDSYLWIDSEDMPRQDLISYFPTTNEFIEAAVSRKENVLVHCIAGVSRSATIVTAYLMKKKNKPAEECLEKVREKRSIIDPNEGFRKQLKLFETMGYQIDVLNKDYRLIALDQLILRLSRRYYAYCALNSSAANDIFQVYLNKLAKTEALHQSLIVFKCKKCRTKLFTDINVISEESEECQSIYIEPQVWMRSVLQELTVSDINCPQCTKKIGRYDLNGINCDTKCAKHSIVKGIFKVNLNHIDADKLNIGQTVHISEAQ